MFFHNLKVKTANRHRRCLPVVVNNSFVPVALVVAFGSASSKGLRADWVEETKDYGNRLGVVAGMTYGFKLPKFNGKVFGSIAVDTAISNIG